MRIAAVDAFRLHPEAIKEAWDEDQYVWPSRLPCFVVRVTAEDGSFGVGEAASQQWYLGETAEQIASCLALYDDALRGADAANVARCHRLMLGAYGGAMPGGRSARSGVDMALYDLLGKARGEPVHALLGGAWRTDLTLLTNLYHKTPESMAAGCREFVDRGFLGLKVKVGDVLLEHGFSREALLAELAKLDAALEVTPREVMVDADANQGWESAAWTVQALRRYHGRDNLGIEQPLGYDDLAGHAHVRRAGGVPVVLDESMWSPARVLEAIRMNACDRMVLKLNRVGGFWEAMKVVAICEAAGVGVSVDTNPYTLIGDTACCHVAAVIRTHYPVDCEGHQSFLSLGPETIVRGGIVIEKGLARLPDAPGLGVQVDFEALARHQAANA